MTREARSEWTARRAGPLSLLVLYEVVAGICETFPHVPDFTEHTDAGEGCQGSNPTMPFPGTSIRQVVQCHEFHALKQKNTGSLRGWL